MRTKEGNQISYKMKELLGQLSQNCVADGLFEEIRTTLLLITDEHKDRIHFKLSDKALK